jgi:probable HAF family extracellular repeat protein
VPSSYTVTDLGAFTAYGLNNSGQVVGYNGDAVLWQNGSLIHLGAGRSSNAPAVNDAGQVAGYGTVGGSTYNHAFLWDATHGVTDLGTLLNSSTSKATNINAGGQVVGTSGGRAFLWDSLKGMQDLGVSSLWTGWQNSSTATAINGSGQIIGYSEESLSGMTTYATADTAFFRDTSGAPTLLGSLPGWQYGKALDINDLGQVVGSSGDYQLLPHSITYRPQLAFIWQSGVMTSLGVPAGFSRTEAKAINNVGQVVCIANPGNSPFYGGHPFLWQNGAWTDLGFSSALTVDISNNGQILVVSGGHTYLLTPANGTSFAVTSFPSPTTGGTPGFFTVTVYNGSTIDTGYTGTVWFSSTDSQAVLPSAYTFTAADAGVHTFSATLKTAGTQSITVADTLAGTSGKETGIQVIPAAASRLIISGPASVSAGTSFSITVTAYDAYGNIATGYLGTVHFNSSDGAAILPANYSITTADAGVHTFTGLKLKKKGTQTITVTDTLNSALTYTWSVSVT